VYALSHETSRTVRMRKTRQLTCFPHRFQVATCKTPPLTDAYETCDFNITVVPEAYDIGCPLTLTTSAYKSSACCDVLDIVSNCTGVTYPDLCNLCGPASVEYIFALSSYVNIAGYGACLVAMVLLAVTIRRVSKEETSTTQQQLAENVGLFVMLQMLMCFINWGILIGVLFYVFPLPLVNTFIVERTQGGQFNAVRVLFALDCLDLIFWIIVMAYVVLRVSDPEAAPTPSLVFGYHVAQQLKRDHPT